MQRVELIYGRVSSDRAAEVDRLFLAHADRALLVVPTRAHARRRLEELALQCELPGFWGEPVCEFNDFAAALLRSEGTHPAIVSDFERRLLLTACLRPLSAQWPGLEGAAGSGGLAAHLLRVITQLKQAAVEPDAFRAILPRGADARPLDSLVADAYAAYQKALKAAGAFDVPGLFWEADLLCRERGPRLLANTKLLLFDGFDDFTPSQERLIASAARHVSTLVIGLNYDDDPDRADLYALPARTARALAKRFGATPRRCAPNDPCSVSGYTARHIFWRTKPAPPAALEANLTLVPCAEAAHEAETVARRVKRLILDEGVAPGEIAVVYRRLATVAPTLRAVFAEAGIPVRLVQAPPLARSALGAFVLRLLDTVQTWEREAAVEVLVSPWLDVALEGKPGRAQFSALARAAGVIAGRQEWAQLGHVDRLANSTFLSTVVQRMPEPVTAANALRDAVAWLNGLFSSLPERATARAFTNGFADILHTLELGRACAQLPDASLRDREAHALDALHTLLGTLAGAPGDEELDRDAFFSQLREGLREATFPLPQPGNAVAVLDAPSVRNLRFDHIFFAGLNEGEAPLPPGVNAVYSEADLAALRAGGVALEGREEHALRERLLFQHVLEAPRKSLTLSWRVRDRQGRETNRSPFVDDVAALAGSLAKTLPVPRADCFVPALDEAVCVRGLRNALFHHVRDPAAAFPELCADAAHGARIESWRNSSKPFGNYDGVLADPDLKRELAARFGPECSFSVNRVERYLECPFHFFQEHVLGIADTAPPTPEMDPALRGTLLHRILQAFHQQFEGRAIADIPEEEAASTMPVLVRDAFAAVREPVAPGVLAMECARMEALLLRYLDQERRRDGAADWKPTHFEVRFGRGPGAVTGPVGTEDPYLLETPGGAVRFSGRIDRVDLRADGAVRVVDYKSGIPPAVKDITGGKAIQLLLYARAIEEALLPGRPCAGAVYLQPGQMKGWREALDRGTKKNTWPERDAAMRDAVARAVAGMREGCFAPEPHTSGACRYCGPEKACRFQQARVLRKQQAAEGDGVS